MMTSASFLIILNVTMLIVNATVTAVQSSIIMKSIRKGD